MRASRVAAAIAALAVLPGLVSAAHAGTYDVYSCWAGAGSYLNPDASGAAWNADDSHATLGGTSRYYRAYDECNGAGGSFGAASIPGSAAPAGVFAESRFASPDGTRIQRVRLWRTAYTYGTGSGSSAHRGALFDLADGALFGRGDIFFGGANASAGTGGSASHGIVAGNLLDLDVSGSLPHDFSVRVGCTLDPCPTAGHVPGNAAAPDTSSRIFGSVVTLVDTNEPSLGLAKTGLLGDGAHSGVQPVVVDLASDISGITRIEVLVDGASAPLGLADFSRDQSHCIWSRKLPCTPVKDLSIPVDTRAIADGAHTVTVRAFDAASNPHDHPPLAITVRNTAGGGSDGSSGSGSQGPSGGQTRGSGGSGHGGSSRGTSGGSPGGGSRGSDALEEFFPSRNPLNGLHASEHARMTVAFVRNGKTRLSARFGSRPRIRGRLKDSHGRAIAFAEVLIQGRRAGSHDEWGDIGTAHTHRTGRFSFRLPRDAGSMELRVVYRAHVAAGESAATRRLVVKIQWDVRLGVTPRSVRNGDAITFSGVLYAGRGRRSEKLVDMQVKIGRKWRTFATTRAAPDGSFGYRYRFRRTFRPVTYRFRALSRYEVGWPYSSGASRSVRVHVHG
jgi:hypothetical protein